MQEALTGHFTDHDAFMLGMMLTRIDALTTQINTLTTRIGEAIAPHAAQVAQLDEIPGIGTTAAQDILAEIGADMTASLTPAAWCPGPSSRPGPASPPAAAKPPPPARATPGWAAPSARPPPPPPAPRPSWPPATSGSPGAAAKQRALIAVGNSLLTIAWHLLSDPAAHFTDLGPDWHDRLAPLRRKRQLIAELERLSGKKVTLRDAA